MFVDNAGQLLADVMTADRSLVGSVSASILDTSNYTFQAISYGKDPSGFGYHAHANIDSAFSWISYTKDPKIVEKLLINGGSIGNLGSIIATNPQQETVPSRLFPQANKSHLVYDAETGKLFSFGGYEILSLIPALNPIMAGVRSTFSTDSLFTLSNGQLYRSDNNIFRTLTRVNNTYTWNIPTGVYSFPYGISEFGLSVSSGGSIVIFGGYNISTSSNNNDTWIYNTRMGTFNRIDIEGPKPLPRHGHVMCFDPTIGEVVLHGGCSGNIWGTYAAAGLTRAPRGEFNDLFADGDPRTPIQFNDTWKFNGTRWEKFTTTNSFVTAGIGVSPNLWSGQQLARMNSQMIYDTAQNRLILFGGRASVKPYLETNIPRQNLILHPHGSNPCFYPDNLYYTEATSVLAKYPNGFAMGWPSHPWDTWDYDDVWEMQSGGNGTWTRLAVSAAFSKSLNPALQNDRRFNRRYTGSWLLGYDNQSHKIILHGGLDREGISYASIESSSLNFSLHRDSTPRRGSTYETWEWNNVNNNWTLLNLKEKYSDSGIAKNMIPDAMAFDPVANKFVIFGHKAFNYGSDINEIHHHETISKTGLISEYDYAESVWNPVIDYLGSLAVIPEQLQYKNSMWYLSGSHNTNWINVNSDLNYKYFPDLGISSQWHDTAAAYDPIKGRVIQFGGNFKSSNGTLYHSNDTWSWDGIKWTLLCTSGPRARYLHKMCYDESRQCIVLFGGISGSLTSRNPVYYTDTWEWTGSNWTLADSYGLSAISSNQVSNLPGRINHAMAFDSNNNRVTLHGGKIDIPFGLKEEYSDIHTWDGSKWTFVPTNLSQTPLNEIGLPVVGTIPRRHGHSMSYDQNSQKLIITYGATHTRNPNSWASPAVFLSGSVAYDSDTSGWVDIKNNGPESTRGSAMVFNPTFHKHILFGGATLTPTTTKAILKLSNQTWEKSNDTTWANKTAPDFPPTGPGPRVNHAMCSNDIINKVIMFGGVSGPSEVSTNGNDGSPHLRIDHSKLATGTWEYDCETSIWNLLITDNPVPTKREGHAMAFLPPIDSSESNGVAILFGGRRDYNSNSYSNEIWQFSFVTNQIFTWKQIILNPTSPKPTPRAYHTLVSGSNNTLILFGGETRNDGEVSDETWEFRYSQNDGESYWTKVTTTTKPEARRGHCMAQNAGIHLMLGGYSGTIYSRPNNTATFNTEIYETINAFTDSWVYDFETKNWEQKSIEPISPRTGACLSYKSPHENQVGDNTFDLFGGYNALSGTPANIKSRTNEPEYLAIALSVPTAGLYSEIPVTSTIRENHPGKRSNHSMVYNKHTRKTLSFGGNTIGSNNTLGLFDNDTYEWDGIVWKKLLGGISPFIYPKTLGMVTSGNDVLIFGSSDFYSYNDVWKFTGNFWEKITTTGTSPLVRLDSGVVKVDPPDSHLLVFGGTVHTDLTVGTLTQRNKYNDVWTLNANYLWEEVPGRNRWSSAVSSSLGNCCFLNYSNLIYDTSRGKLVLIRQDMQPWDYSNKCWNHIPIMRIPQTGPESYDNYQGIPEIPRDSNDLNNTGRRPTAICGFSLAYDTTTNKSIMFGGCNVSSIPSSEIIVLFSGTWGWNGTRWNNLTQPVNQTQPMARYGHAMTYDSDRDRMVMYGGTSASNNQSTQPWTKAFSDTWEFSAASLGANKVWGRTNLEGHGLRPSSRYSHAMVFDSNRKKTVLFGGSNGGPIQETWEFDGRTSVTGVPGVTGVSGVWTPKSSLTQQPEARFGHSMAYDSGRNRTVLFGGNVSSTTIGFLANCLRNDTWEWDGISWVNKTSDGQNGSPSRRSFGKMAYDQSRGKIVLTGGFPIDEIEGSNFNFGSIIKEPEPLKYQELKDMWEWDGTSWTEIKLEDIHPVGRSQFSIAYNSSFNKMLVHGGAGDSWGNNLHFYKTKPVLGGTWEFDITNKKWAKVAVTVNGGPRGYAVPAAMAYHPESKGIILIGCPTSGALVTGATLNSSPIHVWKLKSAGDENLILNYVNSEPYTSDWEFLPYSTAANYPRQSVGQQAVMVKTSNFPTSFHGVMMFGGSGHAGASPNYLLNKTWVWHNSTWTEKAALSTNTKPEARIGHAMAFNSKDNRVLLFGGASAAPAQQVNPCGDTWEFNGVNWSRFVSLVSPEARISPAMAYDIKRNRTVMFGGSYPAPGPGPITYTSLNDTWEFESSTNWTQVQGQIVGIPSRMRHAMAYDSNRNKTVMFGGIGIDLAPRDDTWEWNGSTWTQVSVTGIKPSPRHGHVMVYDPLRHVIVLYGGSYAPVQSLQTANWTTTRGPFCSDTWEFNGTTWSQINQNDGIGEQGSTIDVASTPVNNRRSAITNLGDTAATSGIFMYGGLPDSFGGTKEAFVWRKIPKQFGYIANYWSAVPPPPPPPQSYYGVWGHAAAYNPNTNKVCIWGGTSTDQDTNSTNNSRFIEFNLTNSQWTVTNIVGTLPANRCDHKMQWCPLRGKIIMTGGNNLDFNISLGITSIHSTDVFQDTWSWDASNFKWVEESFATNPSKRINATLNNISIKNTSYGGALLIGGTDRDYTAKTGLPWNDWKNIYVLSSTTATNHNWNKLGTYTYPLGIDGHSTAYCSGSISFTSGATTFTGTDGFISYGGKLPDNTFAPNCVNFGLRQNNGNWTLSKFNTINAAIARSSHSIVYVESKNYFLMFGGFDAAGNPKNTTHTLALSGSVDGAWTTLPMLNPPPARFNHKMVYNDFTKEVTMTGGSDQQGIRTDSWKFNTNNNYWTPIADGHPTRSSHGFVFDVSRKQYVTFGGLSSLNSLDPATSSTYESGGSLWSPFTQGDGGFIGPNPRKFHETIYSNELNGLVLFGGDVSGSIFNTPTTASLINSSGVYLLKNSVWEKVDRDRNPRFSDDWRGVNSEISNFSLTYGPKLEIFPPTPPLNPSGNDGIIKVISRGNPDVSSYQTSTTSLFLKDIYSQYPNAPTPFDQALEKYPTKLNLTSKFANWLEINAQFRNQIPGFNQYIESVKDFGQCQNNIIDGNTSSIANIAGCFPSENGTEYWILDGSPLKFNLFSSFKNIVSSVIIPENLKYLTFESLDPASGSIILSGILYGTYNKHKLMDKEGFLKFSIPNLAFSIDALSTGSYLSGVLTTLGSEFPESIKLTWIVPSGDAGSLLLFGGIYHLGLWYLDMKEMLKQGYYPPYAFDPLNNKRKYKLFAKQTFNKDLLYNTDAFKELFDAGNGWGSLPKGLVLNWDIKFV